MTDPLSCPTCSFANALGAETCAKCGAILAETPERIHPGETLRDPDDLTLPPSPLLRAVLRGEPDAFASPRVTPATPATEATVTPIVPAPIVTPPPAPVAPPPARMTVETLSPTADQAALLRDLAERLHARKPDAPIHYAGFFSRVFAFLIDGGILAAFAFPLAAAGYYGIRAGMLVLGRTAPVETDETILTLLMVAWFVMATIYFTMLHVSHGQTIGKSMLGIEVRTLHLGRIGFGRALLRTLAYAASSSFLGFGFFLVALTPRKRGWHDFIAGTCVVHPPTEEATT